MSKHDDALVEAVADAIQYSDGYRSEASRVARELYLGNARAAIAAVRAYDEQESIPCGHCQPGLDSIRCGCKIGGDDALMVCPNCGGSGQYDDCTCSVCEGDGELTGRQWKGE